MHRRSGPASFTHPFGPCTSLECPRPTHVAPAELRRWNETAPQVAVGMEGAPGHQASALEPDGVDAVVIADEVE